MFQHRLQWGGLGCGWELHTAFLLDAVSSLHVDLVASLSKTGSCNVSNQTGACFVILQCCELNIMYTWGWWENQFAEICWFMNSTGPTTNENYWLCAVIGSKEASPSHTHCFCSTLSLCPSFSSSVILSSIFRHCSPPASSHPRHVDSIFPIEDRHTSWIICSVLSCTGRLRKRFRIAEAPHILCLVICEQVIEERRFPPFCHITSPPECDGTYTFSLRWTLTGTEKNLNLVIEVMSDGWKGSETSISGRTINVVICQARGET